jgi:hypothetical protein
VGCGRQGAQTANADVTVFVNRTVLPIDAVFSEHEALGMSGNRILAVGSREDVPPTAGRGARTAGIDGRSYHVMPRVVYVGDTPGHYGGYRKTNTNIDNSLTIGCRDRLATRPILCNRPETRERIAQRPAGRRRL